MKLYNKKYSIVNTYILESSIVFLGYDKNIDIKKQLYKAPINIDLDLTEDTKNEEFYRIIIQINNLDKKKQYVGYDFIVKMAYDLKISKTINDDDKKKFISYSVIPMIINHIRGHIIETTSSFPAGKYILPFVDVESIIEDYIKKVEKLNKKSN